MMLSTAVMIDKELLAELQRLAAARGQTLSTLIHQILREAVVCEQRPLPPAKNMGQELVNVSDRNALYDLFDEDSHFLRSADFPRS